MGVSIYHRVLGTALFAGRAIPYAGRDQEMTNRNNDLPAIVCQQSASRQALRLNPEALISTHRIESLLAAGAVRILTEVSGSASSALSFDAG
jgi:hypothetical protein